MREGNGEVNMQTVPSNEGAPRPLHEIAGEIQRDWKNIFFGAVPYLRAMASLDSIRDSYGGDSGKSAVLYFLSNAHTYRGDTARRVKAELKAALKGA
jgi:hypothetical protein